jgi:L-ascorbate metabolism protein UlaG (beta-lactamase superfamily)
MASRATDRRLGGAQPQLGIQLVGGPTAILEYGGLRWLTDPTLSPPGEYGGLTKLTGPALDVSQQDRIDIVSWSEVEFETPRGGAVKVTAVHAQHGLDGSDEIQGPVLGFVLSAAGADRIYVSGDNASRDVVRAIVQRTGELPIAILNAGAVQLPNSTAPT